MKEILMLLIAVIDLGVGKNMVSSIRFWLKSFGLYDGEHLSELADYLFDEVAGRDKYMEDLATLWLLHFTIVTSGEATLYDWLFKGLQKERKEFDRAQVLSYVKRDFWKIISIVCLMKIL